MSKLSHVDEAGAARMVDISAKDATERVAEARGRVVMAAETVALIQDQALPKGDVLAKCGQKCKEKVVGGDKRG